MISVTVQVANRDALTRLTIALLGVPGAEITALEGFEVLRKDNGDEKVRHDEL
jgi:hypothetical protein